MKQNGLVPNRTVSDRSVSAYKLRCICFFACLLAVDAVPNKRSKKDIKVGELGKENGYRLHQ